MLALVVRIFMSDLRIPSGTTVAVPGDHHISDRPTSSAPSTRSWGTRASSLERESSTEFSIAQEGKGVWDHSQGVVIGAKDAVVDGVQGLWGMLETSFDLLNPFDRDKQIETYEGIKNTAKVIWEEPIAVGKAIFEPITSRLEQGKYGEALGYGVVEVVFALLGAKGADKVAKASVLTKVDDVGKVGKSLSKTAKRTISDASVTKVVHKGVTRTMLTKEGFASLPRFGKIDPYKIRFSQDSVSSSFRPPQGSVKELIAKLKAGTIDSSDIKPIRIVERNGEVYTLDNRRLYAFQKAGVDIPYQKLDRIPKRHQDKFNSVNKGMETRVRGLKNGIN